MKIIDRTSQSMGWNNPWQTRTIGKIIRIVIHHSATASGNMQTFENHWRKKGWRNGGYAEIILSNGDVELCYPPTVVTNGAGIWNKTSYHICMVGNFRKNGAQPTTAQMRTLLNRIRHQMGALNVPANEVKGHKELMPTICPGLHMNNLRKQLRQQPVASTPNNQATHTVRSGETLSAIAGRHGTTVKVLQDLNNIQNANRINVGQVLRLPTTSATNNQTIRVGSRVRVNNNALIWATGQAIPTWVRGQTYTVQQIRNNNNELLLTGIMSWIHRRDVTVV